MLSRYEHDQLQAIAARLTIDDPDLADLLSGRRFRRGWTGFRAARKARREHQAALAKLEQPERIESSPLEESPLEESRRSRPDDRDRDR